MALACRSDTKETWDIPAFHTLFLKASKGNDQEKDNVQRASFKGMNIKEILDPTGCGNTFCGGFLVGWYKTRNLLTAALWGSISASFSKCYFSGLNYYDKKEIILFYRIAGCEHYAQGYNLIPTSCIQAGWCHMHLLNFHFL